MLLDNLKKNLEFRGSCLKPYISILQRLQILAIFVIRTSGRILPTYEQSDAFLSQNEFYLASVTSFSFYPQFSLFSHSFFPTQHISDRSVIVQHSTVQFLVSRTVKCSLYFVAHVCVYTPLGL